MRDYLQILLVGDDELGEGSERGDRADPVTNLERGHGVAYGVDDAGVIGAGDEGEWGLLLVLAEDLEVVGVVEARGADPNPNGGGGGECGERVGGGDGDRRGGIGGRERGVAKLVAEERLHRSKVWGMGKWGLGFFF